jgi:hypothetical protein
VALELPDPAPLARAHCAHRGPSYQRRRPEETALYQVVREELESFLARARERDRPVPRFVERELRAFLACGILAHGFLRVYCDACRCDRLVAFSCKGRGFCPSCGGRRMADTAAHLVDRVLPEVPVRQWVLSLPFALRYRLAYDSRLAGQVLGLFVRAVSASLRLRARRQWGVCRGQCGAVTFVQRFGDALNLNVHFHSLLLDGVFEPAPGGAVRFRPLPPPDTAEVERVVTQIARRLRKLLERRGLGLETEPSEADPLGEGEPLLAALYGASVSGRIATGPRAGKPVVRLGDRIDVDDLPVLQGERCASVAGVSLHANVAVPARDRPRLERLCRYVARPPVATERLSRLPDGRLLYRLKHRWRDGTTHVLYEPGELVEKLAALVPPPRFHLVRYHGILGPCASRRGRVVPSLRNGGDLTGLHPFPEAPTAGPRADGSPAASRSSTRGGVPDGREPPREPVPPAGERGLSRPRRLSWAELMRRVFAIDVLECPRCAGPMRILAAIQPPEATRAILECLELPSRAPPALPPRPEREEAFLAIDLDPTAAG